MHKLETQGVAPAAFSLLTIESPGDVPAIILSTSDAWKPEADDWLKDDTKRKQVVSYFGGDGRAIELIGAVAEANAVEIGGAVKVVVLVGFKLDKKSGQNRVAIEKVVEVTAKRGAAPWKLPGWGELPNRGVSVDLGTGKINRAA